jgi:hypothetical protein
MERGLKEFLNLKFNRNESNQKYTYSYCSHKKIHHYYDINDKIDYFFSYKKNCCYSFKNGNFLYKYYYSKNYIINYKESAQKKDVIRYDKNSFYQNTL